MKNMKNIKRILCMVLVCCLAAGMLPGVAFAVKDNDVVWLDELSISDSDRYTGNMGDSFIDKIGTRNGTIDTEGNDYSHGLEAWIARWNFMNESSWAWCTYSLDGQYKELSGTIGILDRSYNKTNFNTTIEIWGDEKLLYSSVLTPNMTNKAINLDVSGVNVLKISLYDNESASGGTSFALGDFRLNGSSTGATSNEYSFQGHSYQLIETKMSWNDAKAYCESLGGHLATITSQEENDFIYKNFIEIYGGAMIGLSDADEEGEWKWVTGEVFSYSNWDSGEPNNEGNEDYVLMRDDGTWNDGHLDREKWMFICEWDGDNSGPIIADTISDETILRAKLLTVDHSFDFYRNWDSPVQTMAEQLDPLPASAWYTIENLIDMYYKAAKDGGISSNNVAEVTNVEFYEYLLFKLLDNEELNYLSVTEPFGLIDDLTGGAADTDLMKKLISAGFKSGTKITSENKSKIKDICVSICGTDDVTDIGWLDAVLVSGKTIDDFASEFVKLYALTTVSDARAEAIRVIGENAQVSALRTAAENVYSSIQQAKEAGIDYCVSEGIGEGIDGLATWLLDKMVDVMCDIHPASKLWKKTADTTTFIMDTIFLTDDISTDTIYILGMANVERALLNAIDQAETAFLKDESVANAQKLIALADTLKREILEGCDLVTAQINHCERGDLNWHGILDLLKMAAEKKFDFTATIKWIFGDENSSYAKLRDSVNTIRTCAETADFYAGSVSVLELLRDIESTTPSTWAGDEVNKAINYGILPDWMQNNYQNNITRIEFCALLEYMIEVKTGKTVPQLADELAQEQGGYITPPFDDALYMEVNEVARLGIINGVGNNQFDPLGEITRQEAAVMLYRTANVLGYDTASYATDHSGVANWAIEGVDFVTTKGVMNGTGDGFDPEGKYTKEQAILTMVRFIERVN